VLSWPRRVARLRLPGFESGRATRGACRRTAGPPWPVSAPWPASKWHKLSQPNWTLP
jgi:hypothetical protein